MQGRGRNEHRLDSAGRTARPWLATITALALTSAPLTASAAAQAPATEAEPPGVPPVEGPAPAEPAAADARLAAEQPAEPPPGTRLRKAGVGLIATGGVVATTGFGLTLAFTILGDQRQALPEPVLADVERMDDITRVGGILLASGIAIIAIGGVVFGKGIRKSREPGPAARLRVAPAFGGLVLSGRF